MTNELQTIEENETAVAEVQNDPMLAMIDRVCSDPSFDINKMEKLIEMRNNELNRQASIEFNRDFAKMQKELPTIVARHDNNQTNSKFAKLDDIIESTRETLSQYNFGVKFETIDHPEEVEAVCILKHDSGFQEENRRKMPLDMTGAKGSVNKTKIHGRASAGTYAKRHAYCDALCIAIIGDDKDGNMPSDVISEEQLEDLREAMDDAGVDVAKFCQHFRIQSLNEMPASRYFSALGMVNQRKAKAAKDADS